MDYTTNETKEIVLEEVELKPDTEYLMTFINQLDTVILTHHDMTREMHGELCELKRRSRDLYELISGSEAKKHDISLARLNVFYYDEYIKLLRGYFELPEEAEDDNYQMVLVATAKMKEMIASKQKKFVQLHNTFRNDLEFFLKQIDSDLPMD